MNRFIINSITFFFSFFLLLILFDVIVTGGLQKSQYGHLKEWNEIYNGNINADVLIMGSSRAYVHISPRILDSILNVNSYNLGINGHDFYLQYHKFKEYMKSNIKPKYIIQTLGLYTLEKRDDLFEFYQFLPYLYKTDVRAITSKFEGLTKKDYFFPFVRYFKKKELIKIGFLSLFEKEKQHESYKGYKPNNWKWDNSFDEFKKNHPQGIETKYDEASLNLFRSFILECNENKIQLILVNPPIYYEIQDLIKKENNIFDTYSLLSAEYNINYINYNNSKLSYNKNNFYNSFHLNKNGAELFSIDLAKKLKTIIKTIN